MIYDTDLQIKLHSIDLLINVIDLISIECKKSRVIPTILDLLTTANEDIYKRMSFHIGKFVHKVFLILSYFPYI